MEQEEGGREIALPLLSVAGVLKKKGGKAVEDLVSLSHINV